jgi:hypothetical protein
MSTTDLEKATRELFVRSYVDQIHMRTPFLEELQRRHQVTHKAGKYIERLIDTADTDDLVQTYSVNDSLTDDRKETLDKPRFTWRKSQMPVRYDADEELENFQGDGETQLLDLSKFLVKKAQTGMQKWLAKQMFNSGSTTPVADGDTTNWQSLISALNHDTTFGTLGRSFSAGTNDHWQGADPAGLLESISSSSQDTAYTLTKGNLAKWINETDVSDSMESPEDLMILLCPTLYDKLRAEFEAHTVYKSGLKQSQGITSMVFDGHEIVSVPYLQRSSTMRSWLFILNLKHFELRIHTSRNFKFTGMKWQGENANGYDYYLGRILLQGNLVCWKPKSSLWLSSVS